MMKEFDKLIAVAQGIRNEAIKEYEEEIEELKNEISALKNFKNEINLSWRYFKSLTIIV